MTSAVTHADPTAPAPMIATFISLISFKGELGADCFAGILRCGLRLPM
jgi:hypothetical protein